MPNQFVIHNEEYESGWLEGVQENLAITSQAGFSPISVSSERVHGDFEKESIFSGDITFNDRDPSGAAVRPEERLKLLENIGVKVHYNTNRQVIPQADLQRSNFDNALYSNQLGVKVAQSEMRYILNLSIAAYITATINADPSLEYINAGAFGKTDLINLMRPLKDNASRLAGWLTSSALAFDILTESTEQNRYGESGVVYGASAGTYNVPMMSTSLSSLLDGTSSYILAMYENAVSIKLDSNPPSIVINSNDDTENHYQTWSLDGSFNLKLRNLPYLGGGGYVKLADLTTPANWGKTASISNLGGSVGKIG